MEKRIETSRNEKGIGYEIHYENGVVAYCFDYFERKDFEEMFNKIIPTLNDLFKASETPSLTE